MRWSDALYPVIAVCIAGCTHSEQPTSIPSTHRMLTGWISFQGEFMLYPQKEDVGRLYDKSCVSGTFAKRVDFRKVARRFKGKHVQITGLLLPAEQYYSDMGLNQVGYGIENYCASSQVMIATTIVGEP